MLEYFRLLVRYLYLSKAVPGGFLAFVASRHVVSPIPELFDFDRDFQPFRRYIPEVHNFLTTLSQFAGDVRPTTAQTTWSLKVLTI